MLIFIFLFFYFYIFIVKGITVLGGENSKRLDLGIYVKSVTEGGAAWRDGRLKAGKIMIRSQDNLLPYWF